MKSKMSELGHTEQICGKSTWVFNVDAFAVSVHCLKVIRRKVDRSGRVVKERFFRFTASVLGEAPEVFKQAFAMEMEISTHYPFFFRSERRKYEAAKEYFELLTQIRKAA